MFSRQNQFGISFAHSGIHFAVLHTFGDHFCGPYKLRLPRSLKLNFREAGNVNGTCGLKKSLTLMLRLHSALYQPIVFFNLNPEFYWNLAFVNFITLINYRWFGQFITSRQLFLAIKLIAFLYISNSKCTGNQLWNSQTGFKLKKKHYNSFVFVVVPFK